MAPDSEYAPLSDQQHSLPRSFKLVVRQIILITEKIAVISCSSPKGFWAFHLFN